MSNLDDKELRKAMEDVKVIRTILDRSERSFPGRPWMFFAGAAGILGASIIQYAVPSLRNNLDQAFLVVWLPTLALLFILLVSAFALIEHRGEIKLTRPAREILFIRFIIAPTMATFLYLLYRDGHFMPPLLLMGLAVFASVISMVLPIQSRVIPLTAFAVGLVEVIGDWRSAELGLANGIFVAACAATAGFMVRRRPIPQDSASV